MKRPGGWRSSLSSLHVPEESSTKWSQRSCCTDFNQASAGLFFSLNPSAESMKGLGGLCVWLLPPLPKSEGLGSAHPLQQCRAMPSALQCGHNPCCLSSAESLAEINASPLSLFPLFGKLGKGSGKGRCANSSRSSPLLLACKKILKQYIQNFLVKAFLSPWVGYISSSCPR